MSATQRLILLLGLGLLVACAAPRIEPPPLPTEPPAIQVADPETIFIEAVQLYNSERYTQAYPLFAQFVSASGDSPRAPEALIYMSNISELNGQIDQAQRHLAQILESYPQSVQADMARVRGIEIFAQQDRFTDVIQWSSDARIDRLPDSQRARIYQLRGDALAGSQLPDQALLAYAKAYGLADSNLKLALYNQIGQMTANLSVADLQMVLPQVTNPRLAGDILFEVGRRQITEQKEQEALAVLTRFVQRYPQHPLMDQARDLIDSLGPQTPFQSNTIGCLLPLSGPYEKIGQNVLSGIELALHHYNLRGNGPPPNVLVKDTGGNAEQAVAALRELVSAGAGAVIGPIITAEAVALEAQLAGIPILTLTQKAGIPQIGDYVFRNFITPEMQARAVIAFVCKTLGLDRFAILYPDEAYGSTFMNLFWDQILANGGRVTAVAAYPPANTDFAADIKKMVGLFYPVPKDIKEHRPKPVRPKKKRGRGRKQRTLEPVIDFDAVVIPDAPAVAGLVIPQLAYHDIRNVFLLGTNLWHSPKLIEMAQRFVQDAVVPSGFFAQSQREPTQQFSSSYLEAYGRLPGFIDAIGYDSAMMLFELLKRPDMRYRSNIRHALQSLEDYQGVTGPTRFGPEGEADKQIFLLTVAGDQFVELDAQAR